MDSCVLQQVLSRDWLDTQSSRQQARGNRERTGTGFKCRGVRVHARQGEMHVISFLVNIA